MKTLLLLAAFAIFQLPVFCQDANNADELIEAGIKLHDAGDYDGAIAKYKEVLSNDPNNIRAAYELSNTFMYKGNNQEVVDICRAALKKPMPDIYQRDFYVTLGSAYDNLNQTKDALNTYNNGLKKFPGYYLLCFNKGVTLLRQQESDKAAAMFEQALRDNPLHVSSHYYNAYLAQQDNKIAAVLAGGLVNALSPGTKRADYTAGIIEKVFAGNLRQDSGNAVTIFLPPSLLDKKNKKAPNDFSTVEMMVTLTAGLDKDKTMDSIARTKADKLDMKLQLLINMLTQNKGKGFYWTFYAPFYVAMKENNYTGTFAHLILYNSGDEANKTWLAENADKVNAFAGWVNNFTWNKE